jgi:hypothetical protein
VHIQKRRKDREISYTSEEDGGREVKEQGGTKTRSWYRKLGMTLKMDFQSLG